MRPLSLLLGIAGLAAQLDAQVTIGHRTGIAMTRWSADDPPSEVVGNWSSDQSVSYTHLLGIYASAARLVTQSMFLAAAEVLASIVSEQEIHSGAVYPSLTRVREVSHAIAVAVCHVAIQEKLTTLSFPEDLSGHIRSLMYEPNY